MTEVPTTTGETGKAEPSGVFPLRCHETLEGHKTNWGMTKVMFSTSEASAAPTDGFGILDLLLMPAQVQLTKSSLWLTLRSAILLTRHHSAGEA